MRLISGMLTTCRRLQCLTETRVVDRWISVRRNLTILQEARCQFGLWASAFLGRSPTRGQQLPNGRPGQDSHDSKTSGGLAPKKASPPPQREGLASIDKISPIMYSCCVTNKKDKTKLSFLLERLDSCEKAPGVHCVHSVRRSARGRSRRYKKNG